MSHKKCGPDRFSRFDVYWIQIDKQTNRQTDKPNLYIDQLRKPRVDIGLNLNYFGNFSKFHGQRWALQLVSHKTLF